MINGLNVHDLLGLAPSYHMRADDMPGHIESMFDDCDCASDASSVLRRWQD